MRSAFLLLIYTLASLIQLISILLFTLIHSSDSDLLFEYLKLQDIKRSRSKRLKKEERNERMKERNVVKML